MSDYYVQQETFVSPIDSSATQKRFEELAVELAYSIYDPNTDDALKEYDIARELLSPQGATGQDQVTFVVKLKGDNDGF